MIDTKDNLNEQNNITLYIVNDDTGEVLKQRTLTYNENRQDEIKTKLIGKKRLRIYKEYVNGKTKYDARYGNEYISVYAEYKYQDDINKKILETNPSLFKILKQLALNANRVTNVVKASYKSFARNWTEIYDLLNIKHHQKLRNDFVKFLLDNKLIKIIDYSNNEKMFLLNPFYFKRSKYCHIYTIYHFLDVANDLNVFSSEIIQYIRTYAKRKTIFMRASLENIDNEIEDKDIDDIQEEKNDNIDTNKLLNEL